MLAVVALEVVVEVKMLSVQVVSVGAVLGRCGFLRTHVLLNQLTYYLVSLDMII